MDQMTWSEENWVSKIGLELLGVLLRQCTFQNLVLMNQMMQVDFVLLFFEKLVNLWHR